MKSYLYPRFFRCLHCKEKNVKKYKNELVKP